MSPGVAPVYKLPGEIVESIVLHIQHPCDLLAFALVNRAFYRVTIPDHLELRYIRCDPYRTSLWRAIIERPRLASHIRAIEMVDEIEEKSRGYVHGRPFVPWIATGLEIDDPLWMRRASFFNESQEIFYQAVSMTNLEKFKCTAKTLTEFLQGTFNCLDGSQDSLRELQVVWEEEGEEEELLRHMEVTKDVQKFRNLRCLSLTLYVPYGQNSRRFVSDISRTLKHLDGLNDLSLEWKLAGFDQTVFDVTTFEYIDCTAFFQESFFPHLRRLTLLGHIHGPETGDSELVVRNFVEKHGTSLTSLHIESPALINGQVPLSVSSLRIDTDAYFGYELDDMLPLEIRAQLIELYAPWISWIDIPSKMELPNLKVLALHRNVRLDILKGAILMTPNLERIQFLSEGYQQTQKYTRQFEHNVYLPILQALTRLPRLTHLAGFIDSGNKMNEYVQPLSEAPSLTYVEIGAKQWVKIIRDSRTRGQSAHFEVVLASKGINTDSWWSFFRDINLP